MSDKLNKTIETIIGNIDQHISTKKVLGEPVIADGVVVFPIVEVTVGMAAGVLDKEVQSKDAAGVGAKLSPTALLVIQNGNTQIVNVKDTDYVNKLIYMIPDIVDKILGVFDTGKNDNEAGDEAVDAAIMSEDETEEEIQE